MSGKPTIKDRVVEDSERLVSCSYQELLAWAAEHDINNRAAWGKYKEALTGIGVDFDALRNTNRSAKRVELADSVTHKLVLYSDAKASRDRFGICGPDREPVWHGMFFRDKDYDGEQSSGEMAAAKKAVWLASKVAEKIGGVVELELRVDAQWLCWSNHTEDYRGGKARALAESAQRLGVVLHVTHIPGNQNPADKWTIAKGYLSWKDSIDKLAGSAVALNHSMEASSLSDARESFSMDIG